MKKYILLPILLVVILVGVYAALPFMAISKIKSAYKQKDVTEFSKHIEIEPVKKSVRSQIIQAMAVSNDPKFLQRSKEEQEMAVSFTEAIMSSFLDINLYFILKSFDLDYEFKLESVFMSKLQEQEPNQQGTANGFDNMDYKINSLSEILVIINPNSKIELTIKREGLDWNISNVKYPQSFFQKAFDEQKRKREEERLKAEAEAQSLSEEIPGENGEMILPQQGEVQNPVVNQVPTPQVQAVKPAMVKPTAPAAQQPSKVQPQARN